MPRNISSFDTVRSVSVDIIRASPETTLPSMERRDRSLFVLLDISLVTDVEESTDAPLGIHPDTVAPLPPRSGAAGACAGALAPLATWRSAPSAASQAAPPVLGTLRPGALRTSSGGGTSCESRAIRAARVSFTGLCAPSAPRGSDGGACPCCARAGAWCCCIPKLRQASRNSMSNAGHAQDLTEPGRSLDRR